MPRMRKNAVAFSAYVTEDCKQLMEFLIEREELSQVVFIRKAVRKFLEGDRKIDERILIKRGEPHYVRRSALVSSYIDLTQKGELEKTAKEQGSNFSQAFFQAILSYCAFLITIDDTGIEIRRR